MTAGVTLVELCCGTAAVSLRALVGRPVETLVGFMGNKQQWAGEICAALGVLEERPARVVLVDAGPWGDVWSTLQTRTNRHAAAALLREWDRGKPGDLWDRLHADAPYDDPIARICQYLWLQGRSAGTVPVWWNGEYRRGPTWNGKPDGAILVAGEVVGRWESPTGSRTESAHERGGMSLAHREKGSGGEIKGPGPALEASRKEGRAYQAGALAERRRNHGGPRGVAASRSKGALYRDRKVEAAHQVDASKNAAADELADAGVPGARWKMGCRGIQYPRRIAQRILFLDSLPWDRVEVIHGDVRTVTPIRGARTLFDPPYRNAPRYAVLLPRAAVVEVARTWDAGGADVLVCEREGIEELTGGGSTGWSVARLPATRSEAVTANFPVRFRPGPIDQLGLWTAA